MAFGQTCVRVLLCTLAFAAGAVASEAAVDEAGNVSQRLLGPVCVSDHCMMINMMQWGRQFECYDGHCVRRVAHRLRSSPATA